MSFQWGIRGLEFSFADVERSLASAHSIASDRRSAFAGRLKHLQRLKFPPGTNTGRGRAATYQVEHIWLLGLVLEINQMGVAPERAVDVVQYNLSRVADGTLNASKDCSGDFPSKHAHVFFFDPAGLGDLMDKPRPIRDVLPAAHGWPQDRASGSFVYIGPAEYKKELDRFSKGMRRRAGMINIAALLITLAQNSASEQSGVHEFLVELEAWAARECAKSA